MSLFDILTNGFCGKFNQEKQLQALDELLAVDLRTNDLALARLTRQSAGVKYAALVGARRNLHHGKLCLFVRRTDDIRQQFRPGANVKIEPN